MSADAATEEETAEHTINADVDTEEVSADGEAKSAEEGVDSDDNDISSVASSARPAHYPLQAPSQQAQRQNILPSDGAANDDGKRYDPQDGYIEGPYTWPHIYQKNYKRKMTSMTKDLHD